ncbi:MAG TPA: hypothetical protein VKG45_12180 [Actinomycetes bacterium]|nr:hypothetical protein [Actinomycetes bacterium]
MQSDQPSDPASPPPGWGRPPTLPPGAGRGPAQGDPAQPAWGQAPAWGAPPPPPRRRRTGLVVALVVAGVVVLGLMGVLLAGVIALTTSEEDEERPAPAPTTAIAGPAVRGDRFAFALPRAWKESTTELRGLMPATPTEIDLLSALEPERPQRPELGRDALILVTRESCPCGDLDRFPAAFLGGVRRTGGVEEFGTPRHVQLGGGDAITFDYVQRRGSLGLRHRAYASVHDDAVYVLDLQAVESTFAGYEGAYQQVAETWQWH